MESWVPLFDIFLNNPTPETEASNWFHRSHNSSLSTTTTTTPPITPTSFLSLITKPYNLTVPDSYSPFSSSSTPNTKMAMYIQTLPTLVQSRILSFLAFDHSRFAYRVLSKLAREMLNSDDFWVKRSARQLLDRMSESNNGSISGDERVSKEFESIPIWIKDIVDSNNVALWWLPVSGDALESKMSISVCDNDEPGETVDEEMEEMEETGLDFHENVITEAEIEDLRCGVLSFESSFKSIRLAKEIREICFERGGDSLEILNLIQPWKADDESASIIVSNILNGSEEETGWGNKVLCSILLPKFLVLEKPASRVLMSATLCFCKQHQMAAEYALLIPLLLGKEGINNSICDVITRIMKECLHQAHVSAICQKLLSQELLSQTRFVCLPTHMHLISDSLVWTESLINLLHNMMLNHNVHFSVDSLNFLVYKVRELAETFSKSLKFGNFLLCLVNKFGGMLKCHKMLLIEVAGLTNTLVTKSIISKLATF